MFKKILFTIIFLLLMLQLSGCGGGGNSDDNGNADPGNTNPGNTNPGNTNPGNTNPGNTNPGNTNPGNNPGNSVTNSKAPVVIAIRTIDVQENSSEILSVVATDPEEQPLSYALDESAADSALLSIDDTGALSFISPPDFENPQDADTNNTYLTRVLVSDADYTTAFDLRINVKNTDTNTTPNTPPQLLQTHYSLPENTTSVGNVLATDKEENPLTFSRNGGDSFEVRLSGPRLYLSPAPNFEQPEDNDLDNQYETTLTISDGELSITANIVVSVTDANDPPVMTTPTTINALEGETFILQLQATDEDNDPLSFYMLGNSAMTVSESGRLEFLQAPVFASPHSANIQHVLVGVTDPHTNQNIDQMVELNIYTLKSFAHLDTSFGDTDPAKPDQALGYTWQSNPLGEHLADRQVAMEVSLDNKIVAVGSTRSRDNSLIVDSDLKLWRYTQLGALDTDLSTGFGPVDPTDSSRRLGYVTHHNANNLGQYPNAMASYEDGKILVAGAIRGGTGSGTTLWRFMPQGTLDTGFGFADPNNPGLRLGYVTHAIDPSIVNDEDQARAVLIASDGSIYVTGYTRGIPGRQQDMALWKFTAQGDLDTTFAQLGYVTNGDVANAAISGSHRNDQGLAIALDNKGNIVVAGYTFTTTSALNLAVWEYSTQGTLLSRYYRDSFFNAQALAITANNERLILTHHRFGPSLFRLSENNQLLDFNSRYNEANGGSASMNQLLIMPDQRILAVGNTYYPNEKISNSTIWQFSESGQLLGILEHNIGMGDSYARSMALVGDNTLLVGGDIINSNSAGKQYHTFVKRFTLDPL